MQCLHFYLLGGVRVETGKKPAEELKLTFTVQLLMSYLLLHRHKTHSRDVLASLLWADYSSDRARNCLSTAIWRLRKILEPPGIAPGSYLIFTPTGEVGFNTKSDYWLDIATFENELDKLFSTPIEQITDAQIQSTIQVMELYTADLLENYYSDWALHEREHLRVCYLDGLFYLMRYFYSSGNFARSLAYGRQILSYDPLREDVHRQMMLAYIKNGQRSLAVRQYHQCCEQLSAELKIMPMVETQDLFKQITAAGPSTTNGFEPQTISLYQLIPKLNTAIQSMELARKNLQEVVDEFYLLPYSTTR